MRRTSLQSASKQTSVTVNRSSFNSSTDLELLSLKSKNFELTKKNVEQQQELARLQKTINILQKERFDMDSKYNNQNNIFSSMESILRDSLTHFTSLSQNFNSLMHLCYLKNSFQNVSSTVSESADSSIRQNTSYKEKAHMIKPHMVNGHILHVPTIKLTRMTESNVVPTCNENQTIVDQEENHSADSSLVHNDTPNEQHFSGQTESSVADQSFMSDHDDLGEEASTSTLHHNSADNRLNTIVEESESNLHNGNSSVLSGIFRDVTIYINKASEEHSSRSKKEDLSLSYIPKASENDLSVSRTSLIVNQSLRRCSIMSEDPEMSIPTSSTHIEEDDSTMRNEENAVFDKSRRWCSSEESTPSTSNLTAVESSISLTPSKLAVMKENENRRTVSNRRTKTVDSPFKKDSYVTKRSRTTKLSETTDSEMTPTRSERGSTSSSSTRTSKSRKLSKSKVKMSPRVVIKRSPLKSMKKKSIEKNKRSKSVSNKETPEKRPVKSQTGSKNVASVRKTVSPRKTVVKKQKSPKKSVPKKLTKRSTMNKKSLSSPDDTPQRDSLKKRKLALVLDESTESESSMNERISDSPVVKRRRLLRPLTKSLEYDEISKSPVKNTQTPKKSEGKTSPQKGTSPKKFGGKSSSQKSLSPSKVLTKRRSPKKSKTPKFLTKPGSPKKSITPKVLTKPGSPKKSARPARAAKPTVLKEPNLTKKLRRSK